MSRRWRRCSDAIEFDADRHAPENELRRWLFLWRWAVKKRWCPVYEILFRAGAEVRPDWRDDPYAFMVEEFRGPICGFTEGSGEL